MSDQIKGIIEAVKDAGPIKGKYGVQHRLSVKVAGEWYGGFFGKSADALGLSEGRLVTFTMVERGEYKNIETKTLKVSGTAAPATSSIPPASPSRNTSSSMAGIKVGHAINNAVQLAMAAGTTEMSAIHALAVDIIRLSLRLESQFDAIVTKVPVKPVTTTVEEDVTEVEDEEEEEAAPLPKAKAKPKPKAKPAPVEPDEPSFDDDDIPF